MPYVRPLLSKDVATQYGSFKKLNFGSKTPEIAPKISFSAGVKILCWIFLTLLGSVTEKIEDRK